MSGGINFRQGGPIAWIAVQQEQSYHSSCEAEIHTTDKISKLLMGLGHLAGSIHANGHDILDTLEPSPDYNDNEACICWSHNVTTKQIRHMEMRENLVREWVQVQSL